MDMGPGVYKNCEVLSHWWTSARTGTRALAVKVRIGEDEITGHVYFTEKSMNLARRQLKELGFDASKQKLSEIGEELFIGNLVTCVLEYDNQEKIRVAMFGTLGGKKEKPPEDELARLDASLRNAKKKVASTEEEAHPFSEGDIPF